ncbi:MAG TPA: serine/threonine-protein kinase [Bryobacteraceae bacterium]|nr:serine/threonine-protein kinase [Bryobacteraceae bacterium]
MNAQRWEKIQELFYRADELPPATRALFLQDVCAGDRELLLEVESLLETAHADPGRVEESVAAVAGHILSSDPAFTLQRVGPYEIVRTLGEGGMGVVYLARRVDEEFQQIVALKIIRPAFSFRDATARFRAERQILANLVHPNIARMLDGGITPGGQPYLVMEYVQGQSISQWRQQRGLRLDEVLELFRSVCAGVQCAHQSLIVHRDIKPANILVDRDGIPKLLDFGVAKLLDSEGVSDSPSTRMMTLEYASPEQILGRPVTTATDVYGLGVLLFELITGRRPYLPASQTALAWQHLICETDPPRPSTLASVDTDVDNIILKAMHRDPERRYATAAELSEDIRRYLEGFPVSALPDSVGYRSRKFMRRHRAGVIIAVLVASLLIGFGVAMAVLARQADTERRRAEQVSKFLVNLFADGNPDRLGKQELTTREMVDRAAREVDKLAGQPEVQSALLDSFGLVYESLGAWDESRALLRRSLEIKRRVYPAESLPIAETAKNLSELCRRQLDFQEAETLCRESIRIRQKLLGARHALVLVSQNTLALILQSTGRKHEAVRIFEDILTERAALRTQNHMETAVLSNLGAIYGELGNLPAAERYLRECIAIRRVKLGATHPRLALALARLGEVLTGGGKLTEAEKALRESLQIRQTLFGPMHREVGRTWILLAETLRKQDRRREAADSLASAKAIGMEEADAGDLLYQQALLASANGNRQQALRLLKECIERRTADFGPSHASVARAREALAGLEPAR